MKYAELIHALRKAEQDRDRLIAATVYSTTEHNGRTISWSWRIGAHSGFTYEYDEVVREVRRAMRLEES